MHRILTVAIILFHFNLCYTQVIDGLTVVAPPQSFKSNPFNEIRDVEAGWVCFVPYGFTRQGDNTVSYNLDWQWWGEKEEGVVECISQAQEASLNIMLKPQVYMPGSWPGSLDFDSETDWEFWEASYKSFILSWAKIADQNNVELLCIGTEFKISTTKRPQFWVDLIADIKAIYCGKLVYSANWDEYDKVSFWKDLDYIGVSTYFPLDESITPSVDDLKKAWKPTVNTLRKYAQKQERQIIFTEFGYLSVDGCCGKTWELEKKVKRLPINEQCQANGLEALFSTFEQEDWWAGGFLWKWFPNGMGHEGYIPRDYTPQQKLSQQTLKTYYSKW